MHFDDLKKLLHLASTQNIQVTAAQLNITSGALSKTLKKTEQQLNIQLFDRVGRNLKINPHGEKFMVYAAKLVHEYQQMCSEFVGKNAKQVANITGPAVLLNYCLSDILPYLSGSHTEINIQAAYEGEALNKLAKNQANIAIVTDEALSDAASTAYEKISLGTTIFQLAVSSKHPSYVKSLSTPLMLDDVLAFPFACPVSSPFCGITRGLGSDGWLDDKNPRKIAFRSDDYNAMLMLIQQGHAVGYIPDFAIVSNGLKSLEIKDFAYDYEESFSFVFKPSEAHGWLNALADKLQHK